MDGIGRHMSTLQELSMYKDILSKDDVSLDQIEKILSYVDKDIENIRTLEKAFIKIKEWAKDLRKQKRRTDADICECGYVGSVWRGDYLHCKKCGMVKTKKKRKKRGK